ncbi:MAG: CHAT domain-containing tetratricopeptide repeat protein, partial [Bacteroidota bacterium]
YQLGKITWESGDIESAMTYFRESMTSQAANYKEFIPDYLYAINNMAVIFGEKRQYDSALKYNDRAYKGLDLLVGNKEHEPLIPYYQTNLWHLRSLIYANAGDIVNSNYCLNQALKIKRNIYGPDHPAIAVTYSALAKNAMSNGNFDEAIDLNRKALEVRRNENRGKSPTMSFSYNDLAGAYLANQQYELAILYYDSALDANNKFNIGSNEIYAMPSAAFNSLHGEARAYSLDKKLDNQFLDSLYSDFIAQVDFIYARTNQKSITRDLQQLQEFFYEQYFKLYASTKQTDYLNRLWVLSELSKSRRLAIHSMHKLGLRSFISEEYILREKNIRDSITSHMNGMVSSNSAHDADSMLFVLTRRYEELIDELEAKYPRYKLMKYDNEIVSLNQVQKRLLPDQVVVEYFVGEKMIYAFLISAKSVDVFRFNKEDDFQEDITTLRQSLSQFSTLKNEEKSYKNFVNTSHKIYQKYFGQIIDAIDPKVSKLTIISDRQLGYIPFEVLLTKTAQSDIMDYKGLDYLLNDYAINYAYSSTSFFSDNSRPKNTNEGLIAFAPEYKQSSESSNVLSANSRYDAIVDLKWNKQEVENIASYLGGLKYQGQDASEKQFKNKAGSHKIIHLALHALVDDEEPMNSRLVFSSETDSLEDGFLNAYELYNMDLDAELVVLSACETGYGKYEYGEGIMSLGRAFRFAGCPSTVTSHWIVDDVSTSKLMTYFYEYLSNGERKDEALRKAKLDYLHSEESLFNHPFYWASFVVVGNTDAIRFTSSTNLELSFLAVIIAFCLMAYVSKLRNLV